MCSLHWPTLTASLAAIAVILMCCTPNATAVTEEDEGVKYADRCEACKILAIELEGRLTETGRSHDVIELG